MPSDQEPRPSTGVTWRRPSRPAELSPRPRDPRIGWALICAGLVAGLAGLAWILGWGPFGHAAPTGHTAASQTISGASGTPEDPRPRTSGPPATPVTVPRTATPAATATAEPSLPSTTPHTPLPTLEPTDAPQTGIVIDFPADGETVVSRVINVIGTGPVGATITRDIPLWFDDHTTVREDGLWMLRVELGEGPNELTFRVGDDRSTEQRFVVIYQPDGG